jgi:CheY-like chemotaxis protein
LILVEDDSTVRSFVRMVLEDLPIEVIECQDVPAALVVLEARPADLILTDLMMPGESGMDLIDRLNTDPTLRGHAKIIMMSAGLTPAIRAQLASRNVWRLLDKPVTVGQLESAVTEGLGSLLVNLDTTNTAVTPAASTPVDPLAEHVQAYFDGDIELYEAYRDAVMAQLPTDINNGNEACTQADWKNLRLVAHSLKSVLTTLGQPDLAELAKGVENASHANDAGPATSGWRALSDRLQSLIQLG